jgi:hypothetical protein
MQILIDDINEYKKQVNFALLKANWRLTEELKKEYLLPDQKKIIESDQKRLMSIAKQVQDLEILNLNY